MTRRVLALIIGGAVVIIALLAILTTAPLVTSAPQSVAKVITSEASESDTVTCATIEFATTLHYTVTRPVLDLWGFRTVDDVTVDPAELNITAAPDTCTGPVEDLGGAAYISTEPCPVDILEPVAQATASTNMGSACDGRLLYYSVLNEGPEQSATFSYHGPQSVAPSGYGRGPWCLGFSSEARYSKNDTGAVAGAGTTSGDLCLDLS